MWTLSELRRTSLTATLCSLALALCCFSLGGCGGAPSQGQKVLPAQDEVNAQPLAADEVRAIMQEAARALDETMAVAVTDRRGVILGVGTKGKKGTDFSVNYQTQCGACPTTQLTPDNPACADCATVNLAIQLARTPSFFSADQTPLTSRSVRFLSGEHFPSGVRNSGAAALFGIENTNRGCAFDARDPRGAVFIDNKFVPRGRNLRSTLRERAVPKQDPLPCQNGLVNAEGGYGEAPGARDGCTTGIATIPGGVPIYKNGRMAGGIGVALRGVRLSRDPVAAFDNDGILRRIDTNPEFTLAEFAARAFAGDRVGFPALEAKGLKGVCSGPDRPACCNAGCFLGILAVPPPIPFDPVIFVDGIEIPEINPNPGVSGVGTGEAIATANFIVDPSTLESTDLSKCPGTTRQACPVSSEWLVGPNCSAAFKDSLGNCTELSDPKARPDGTLTAKEVRTIIEAGVSEALAQRAAIRLPLEARTAMVLAVSDKSGDLLGLYRMHDATVFSIDVAVSKSTNVIYFSDPAINPKDAQDCPGEDQCLGPAFNPPTAITNRTLSFCAQPFFPSGIEASADTKLPGIPLPFAPGPFRRVFINDSLTPCTNGGLPQDGGQPTNGRQSGIVFFPGSAPVYQPGPDGLPRLVGGYGVSGDGVEQDDIVTFAGTVAKSPVSGVKFEAPTAIRADNVFVRGVRLPYVKFNRQPEQ